MAGGWLGGNGVDHRAYDTVVGANVAVGMNKRADVPVVHTDLHPPAISLFRHLCSHSAVVAHHLHAEIVVLLETENSSIGTHRPWLNVRLTCRWHRVNVIRVHSHDELVLVWELAFVEVVCLWLEEFAQFGCEVALLLLGFFIVFRGM